jgi:hypothetical protein
VEITNLKKITINKKYPGEITGYFFLSLTGRSVADIQPCTSIKAVEFFQMHEKNTVIKVK